MPRLIWVCDCTKHQGAQVFHEINAVYCFECETARPDLKDLPQRLCHHEWEHKVFLEVHGDGDEWDECKKCHMHKPDSHYD